MCAIAKRQNKNFHRQDKFSNTNKPVSDARLRTKNQTVNELPTLQSTDHTWPLQVTFFFFKSVMVLHAWRVQIHGNHELRDEVRSVLPHISIFMWVFGVKLATCFCYSDCIFQVAPNYLEHVYIVHHIINNKPTRCNSGSIVFIKNYKYALHVSDALCVRLQEHYKL